MGRIQFIEIEDQAWCPRPIRDGATDYLQFVVAKTKPYQAVAELLNAALERTGADRVIDLCSGAGEPWPALLPAVLGMLLVPLIIILVTPAIRPVRLSRLLFTYLLPFIPLVALFDGIVSCLRTYTPDEMRRMAAPFSGYDWEIGQIPVRGLSAPITYTIGTPKAP